MISKVKSDMKYKQKQTRSKGEKIRQWDKYLYDKV